MVALDGVRPKAMRKVAPVKDRLLQAFDATFFFSIAVSLGGDQIRQRDPLDVYLSSDKFRTLSPNRFFDEIYYRQTNPDVARNVYAGVFLSGLHHYVAYGATEGRMPNADFESRVRRAIVSRQPAATTEDAEKHLRQNEELTGFLRYFPFIDRLDFYNAVGRHLSSDPGASGFRSFVEDTMDTEHYARVAGLDAALPRAELVAHYFETGWRAGLSPRPDFDERFYIAFHDDVRAAVSSGGCLRCGYEHWFVAGQREKRIPHHTLKRTLEARFSGITSPVSIGRIDELAHALRPPPVREVDRTNRVLHILVPDLNPDIFFGGYRSLVELMKHLLRQGAELSIVKTARDSDGLDYFLYHLDPADRALFAGVTATCRKSEMEIGPNDRFLAYSGWDALKAQRLVKYTDCRRFSYLVQEYEPVFMEHNSFRFMLDSAYAAPHFAIFNSTALRNYFRDNRLGIFTDGTDRAGDYTVFEHVLTPPVVRQEPAPSHRRTFFVYARPEAHAGRNLFEIAVLALRAALQRVELDRCWEFVGAGALSEQLPEVPLDGQHTLKLRARMAKEEYAALISRASAGLSLMYAPHPSLVPFELAQNGALVVTNTYCNRDRDFFAAISPNIFAADLTLPAITDALVEVLRKADSAATKPGGSINGPWPKSWDEACAGIANRLREEDLL